MLLNTACRNYNSNYHPADLTGDGLANAIGYDTTGDGQIDALDMNGKGYINAKIINGEVCNEFITMIYFVLSNMHLAPYAQL